MKKKMWLNIIYVDLQTIGIKEHTKICNGVLMKKHK